MSSKLRTFCTSRAYASYTTTDLDVKPNEEPAPSTTEDWVGCEPDSNVAFGNVNCTANNSKLLNDVSLQPKKAVPWPSQLRKITIRWRKAKRFFELKTR